MSIQNRLITSTIRLNTYQMMNAVEPLIPARSRLYSLQPYGEETAYVESITSYTARLAQIHGLTIRQLVEGEIWSLFGTSNHLIGNTNFAASICKDDARALCGTRRWAFQWVTALESLTHRIDLRFSTMLPWRNVLSPLDLVRRERAWCPACYQSWQEANQIIYDPLLWSIKEVTFCASHRQRLLSHCPNSRCQRVQPYLTNRMRSGYCSYCGVWLGTTLPTKRKRQRGHADVSAQEEKWQTWVVEAVGELLAEAPAVLGSPQLDRIGYAMTVSAQHIANGNLSKLAHQIGRHPSILGALLAGKNAPTFSTLLRICYAGNVKPLQFLTQTPLRVNPKRAAYSVHPVFQMKCLQIAKHDDQSYGEALKQTLRERKPPYPSMREMGRRLGCDPHYLYRRFPQLCKEISQQYLKFRETKKEKRLSELRIKIHKAVFDLHRRGVFPSRHRVAQFIKVTIFNRDPLADVWREAIRELGLVDQRPSVTNSSLRTR